MRPGDFHFLHGAHRPEAGAARPRAFLDRLEPAILAKPSRGEAARPNPEDAPASVHLERIRALRAAGQATRAHRAWETADA